jgi:ubiquitin C-terminal hydrolase
MYTTKFASLPQILILNINRAILGKPLYDNIITFEKTLDVKEFVDKNNYIGKSTKYELYAINECFGNSSDSGHYYSFIKIKDNWYKFNDKEVLEKDPKFDSQYVVGLFYKKIDN